MEAVILSSTRNRARWTNAWMITKHDEPVFMDPEALTPMLRKTWMSVCQWFMCVGLLLSLLERFFYGAGAFLFLLETFAVPTLHLSTHFCLFMWCKCDCLPLGQTKKRSLLRLLNMAQIFTGGRSGLFC